MAPFDAENLIGQLLVSGLGGGSSRRRKKRVSRSIRSAALSPQGLTLLGGIAFAAIEHLRGKSAGVVPPASTSAGGSGAGPTVPVAGIPASGVAPTSAPRPANLPPIPAAAANPAPPSGEQDAGVRRGKVLVGAMVEAAKADGAVDAEERTRILEQLEVVGADAEARDYIATQLTRPLDLEGLLASVGGGDPTLAAQVYVASRVVIADETPAESAYLALLAARLGLSDELVRELRSQVDQALEPVTEE